MHAIRCRRARPSIGGLADRADHVPTELSGGSSSEWPLRGRWVAKWPAVLLCDEPTGALDSETGGGVLDVLQTSNEELGTTTALITQNQVVSKMPQRVIHLSDGRVGVIQTIEGGCKISFPVATPPGTRDEG